MLRKLHVRRSVEYALEVITQPVLKISAKHLSSLFRPSVFLLNRPPERPRARAVPFELSLAHCHYFHPPQYLGQLDAASIDAGLDRPFGYPQKINNLLVTQLLYVAQNDTSS